MSANPTTSGTKLIAAVLVICVVLVGIIIGAILNKNPSPDPTPSFDSSICWNVVIDENYWPNACRGSKNKDLACAQVILELTQEEKAEYLKWDLAGQPEIEGC